jgi:hypothetical protein
MSTYSWSGIFFFGNRFIFSRSALNFQVIQTTYIMKNIHVNRAAPPALTQFYPVYLSNYRENMKHIVQKFYQHYVKL